MDQGTDLDRAVERIVDALGRSPSKSTLHRALINEAMRNRDETFLRQLSRVEYACRSLLEGGDPINRSKIMDKTEDAPEPT